MGCWHSSVGPQYIWVTPWLGWKQFMLKDLFSKFDIREIRKFPYEKLSFSFSRPSIPKILIALHSHYTGDTPYWVWFHLDNSLTRWRRPIFKIHYSRNSQKSVWQPNFFLGKLYQIFFLFYNFTARLILHTEFGLIWITSWPDEKDLFLKVFYRNLFEIIANFRMKSQPFSLASISKIFFCFNTRYPW